METKKMDRVSMIEDIVADEMATADTEQLLANYRYILVNGCEGYGDMDDEKLIDLYVARFNIDTDEVEIVIDHD